MGPGFEKMTWKLVETRRERMIWNCSIPYCPELLAEMFVGRVFNLV
jgi:hypothetical protein